MTRVDIDPQTGHLSIQGAPCSFQDDTIRQEIENGAKSCAGWFILPAKYRVEYLPPRFWGRVAKIVMAKN